MLATVERARPTRSAISSWDIANSSTSCAEGVGLLDRVEVLALEVLDERELELLAVGELADDRRDPLEAGELAGPERAARRRRAGSRRASRSRGSAGGRRARGCSRRGARDRASSIRCRGWRGFGRIRSSAISVAAVLVRALRDERGEAAARGRVLALRPGRS